MPRSARSRSICARASGRWIFRATASPESRRASWTWATEAAAIGVGSMSRRRARSAVDSSAASTRPTVSNGIDGTSSWSRASASM